MYSIHTKSIYNHINCKGNLLHCNVNINFNKTCFGMKELRAQISQYDKMKETS
jgi:hypothetical protein